MGLFNFISNVGKKVFGDDQDDIQKRDAIHQEIQELDLPAHLSVNVEGDTVKLAGNVTDTEVKEKILLAIGNIEGVAAVDENILAAEDMGQSEFVTVKSGDTLWKISEEAYGDGSKYNLIFEANKPMLKSADAIFPGQQLRIPALESLKEAG